MTGSFPSLPFRPPCSYEYLASQAILSSTTRSLFFTPRSGPLSLSLWPGPSEIAAILCPSPPILVRPTSTLHREIDRHSRAEQSRACCTYGRAPASSPHRPQPPRAATSSLWRPNWIIASLYRREDARILSNHGIPVPKQSWPLPNVHCCKRVGVDHRGNPITVAVLAVLRRGGEGEAPAG